MGVNIRTRPSAFEEALDIIRRLLAGETMSSSRRFRVAECSPLVRHYIQVRREIKRHRAAKEALRGFDRALGVNRFAPIRFRA